MSRPVGDSPQLVMADDKVGKVFNLRYNARKWASRHRLSELEKRRQAILKKKSPLALKMDAPIHAMAEWSITILPLIVRRIEVWIFTAIHVILFAMKQCECVWDQAEPSLDGNSIISTGAEVSDSMAGGDLGRRLQSSMSNLSVTKFTLSFQAMSITSGLMSLLLVFFNSDCYKASAAPAFDDSQSANREFAPRTRSAITSTLRRQQA